MSSAGDDRYPATAKNKAMLAASLTIRAADSFEERIEKRTSRKDAGDDDDDEW